MPTKSPVIRSVMPVTHEPLAAFEPSGFGSRRSDFRSGLCGAAVSVLVHVTGLALAAMIYFSEPVASFVGAMDSGWMEAPSAQFDIEMPASAEQRSGGVQSNLSLRETTTSDLIEMANISSAVDAAPTTNVVPVTPIPTTAVGAERKGRRGSSGQKKESQAGSGQSSGKGSRGRNRAGFFGRQSEGNRIAFVVDNSRSMGRLEASETQSRYSRVQKELVKSILEMNEDDEFYIVFFCDHAEAMSSRIMQRATDENKATYLEWAINVEMGGGPTNPCGAMNLALRLKPDVIYFLTDGEFERGFNINLLAIESETIIHTFAFGERTGEDVLKAVAAKNKGEYKFIP